MVGSQDAEMVILQNSNMQILKWERMRVAGLCQQSTSSESDLAIIKGKCHLDVVYFFYTEFQTRDLKKSSSV